jgi:6-phosphogluconolactonase
MSISGSIPAASAEQTLVFIGTYTNTPGNAKGIYAARLDEATGKLSTPELAAETLSPTWLTLSPDHKFLYSVNEQGQGTVSAFGLDSASGKLTFLNSVSSKGESPCHIVVSKDGKSLYSANYSGGTVVMFPIAADGKLGEASKVVTLKGSGPDSARQKSPHPHSVNLTKDRILMPDLGQDKIFVYKMDLTAAEPISATVKPGLGPRHMAFHPKGNIIYVLTEMGSSIEVLSSDNMTNLQSISMLPKDYAGKSTGAEVMVHPSGKFVYGSNRGDDSIAVFQTDKRGLLKFVERVSTEGKTPRGFVLDPTGKWLIAGNQDSDSMVIFKVDQKSGKLTPTGQKFTLGAPVAFQFVASR